MRRSLGDALGRARVRQGAGGWRRLFDFQHGQTAVAGNAVELYPVLNFACLSG
jgi:hypothetical protein